jgi:hypothetical protein
MDRHRTCRHRLRRKQPTASLFVLLANGKLKPLRDMTIRQIMTLAYEQNAQPKS